MRQEVEQSELTATQRELLYEPPEAREVFYELSKQTQDYLRLNWLSSSPMLGRSQRKVLRAQVQEMAFVMFGEINKDKPYSREIQKYSDVLLREVWQMEEEVIK